MIELRVVIRCDRPGCRAVIEVAAASDRAGTGALDIDYSERMFLADESREAMKTLQWQFKGDPLCVYCRKHGGRIPRVKVVGEHD